jgi:hypothetical protein
MKAIDVESFFNFTFGTGKDKNLICDLTEFVGSKVLTVDISGDSSSGGSSSSSSNNTEGNASPVFFDLSP